MLKLGWFSTGRGPGSRNLLRSVEQAIGSGYLDAEISFVFCNWDNTEEDNPKKDQRELFFEEVRSYGIPLVTASWKKFMPELRERDEKAWGNEYGKVLRESTGRYGMDLGILAGYMLWTTPPAMRTTCSTCILPCQTAPRGPGRTLSGSSSLPRRGSRAP